MGNTQRQCAVGAWPYPEPEIGLVGEPDVTGIDDDQTHPALQRRDGGGRMSKASMARVVAPQNQNTAVLDIRHGTAASARADAANAIGISSRVGAAPTAKVERGNGIRGPEGIHQPLDESCGFADRGGGWGGYAEGNRLRPVPFRDPPHRRGR